MTMTRYFCFCIKENEQIPLAVEDQLNASDFWDFHVINSFVETADDAGNLVHNQNKVFEGVTINFCYDDWIRLQNNNKFNTNTGAIGEMLEIEWDLHKDTAVVTYKIKELYTKNLKLEFNEGS